MGSSGATTRREIAARIRARIEAGEWPPSVKRADGTVEGTRLPSTRQFAEEYGSSEKTAAEAVAVLVNEGLLWTVPGGGRYVAGEEEQESPS